MNLDAIAKFFEAAHGAVAVITGIATLIMSPANFRSGNQLFLQTRTKRLYEILRLKDHGWRTISSGALQLAVKEAFGMQLSGDEIRFAFERDDPLSLLRSRKNAGGFVKFCPIQACYKDNRFSWLRRWTLRANFQALLLSSIIVYFLTFIPIHKLGTVSTVAAMMLMIIGTFSTMGLMLLARGAESADALMNVDGKYPLPSYGHRLGIKKRTGELSDNTGKGSVVRGRKTSRTARQATSPRRRDAPAPTA
ncbi:hypothetical protein [Burkholderia multivorans]|uniref:hypothetical protein n=1 Tax=Burkholderia multivorans TaxID=87883 RepID=UPI000B09CF00|nr:hypothetical protein [Burkholderia multivorans]